MRLRGWSKCKTSNLVHRILLSMLQRMLQRMLKHMMHKTAAGLAKLLRPQKQLSNAVQYSLLDLMQTCPGLSKQNVTAWSQMPVQIAKLVQKLLRDVVMCEKLAVPSAFNCLDVLRLAGQTYCITFSRHQQTQSCNHFPQAHKVQKASSSTFMTAHHDLGDVSEPVARLRGQLESSSMCTDLPCNQPSIRHTLNNRQILCRAVLRLHYPIQHQAAVLQSTQMPADTWPFQ